MNFFPLFPKVQFEYPIVSMLRSMEILFENFRGLNTNW